MNRKLLALTGALSLTMIFSVGCASKNYVRNQTTPIIDKTNELDDLTAKNSRDIKDSDARAQKGIPDEQTKAAEVPPSSIPSCARAAEPITAREAFAARSSNSLVLPIMGAVGLRT